MDMRLQAVWSSTCRQLSYVSEVKVQAHRSWDKSERLRYALELQPLTSRLLCLHAKRGLGYIPNPTTPCKGMLHHPCNIGLYPVVSEVCNLGVFDTYAGNQAPASAWQVMMQRVRGQSCKPGSQHMYCCWLHNRHSEEKQCKPLEYLNYYVVLNKLTPDCQQRKG